MKKNIIFVLSVILTIFVLYKITLNASSFYWFSLLAYGVAGFLTIKHNSKVYFEKIVNLGAVIIAIHVVIIVGYTINQQVFSEFPWEVIIGTMLYGVLFSFGKGLINAENHPVRDDIYI